MKKLSITVLSALLFLSACHKDPKEEQKVSAIHLDEQTLELYVTDTYQFLVTHEPKDLPAPPYQWSSSNNNVATVSQSGLLTATGEGVTTISVASFGTLLVSACKVTVGKQLATKIELEKALLLLEEGLSEKLAYSLFPSGSIIHVANWISSNQEVATVSQSGVVTAVAEGKAVITVFDEVRPEVKASCSVTVSKKRADKIELSMDQLTMICDQQAILTCTIFPQGAVLLEPFWSSTHPDIAVVDQEGKVTALSAGTTVITFIDKENPKATASCTVTVLGVEATLIQLDLTKITMNVLEEVTLAYQIFPPNSTDKEVVWFSNNEEVALVDDVGKVTAVGTGSCVITVRLKNGAIEGKCEVNVVTQVTSITLDSGLLNMKRGDTHSLKVTFSPLNATPPTEYRWTSSNDWVATVRQDGTVEAQRIGTTTIRAEISQYIYAECRVTVAPVYNNWKEPSLLFGGTQSDIRNAETRKINTALSNLAGSQGLAFDGESGSRLLYCVYFFVSGNMTTNMLAFADNNSTAIAEARGFCAERYKFISESGGITIYETIDRIQVEVGFRNLTDYVQLTAMEKLLMATLGLKDRYFVIAYFR